MACAVHPTILLSLRTELRITGLSVLASEGPSVQTRGPVGENALTDIPADLLTSSMALATYTFALSITPGPNNVMLAASGANFGFRRTLPHMLGISVGFAVQALLVCTGLGAAIAQSPQIQHWMGWLGAACIAWMGWRLLRSGPASSTEGAAAGRPLSMLEAALFQYANPKAWVMALTIAAVFMPKMDNFYLAALLMFAVLVVVIFPCTAVWAAFGSALRGYLDVPVRRRVFNAVMAGLLGLTAVAMLAGV